MFFKKYILIWVTWLMKMNFPQQFHKTGFIRIMA